MSAHIILLIAEISGIIIAALWTSAFLVYGIRRIFNGPDVAEPIDAAFIAKYSARAANDKWYHRALLGLDIFVNMLLRGQADETLSEHAYRAELDNKLWGKVMSYWLSLYQSQHGAKALVGGIWRAKNRIAVNSTALGIK